MVKRIAALQLPGRVNLIARQMFCRPQRGAYHPGMQYGELLVTERLRSLRELRLQKGWRCSADEVLRARFGLCTGGTLADPQHHHEAGHERAQKSSHRTFPVGQGPVTLDADLPAP